MSHHMLEYKDYSVDDTSRHSQSNTATSQTSVIEEDDVIEDIRHLYASELDAEDRMVESFLSSHSRNISEYMGHGSGSPGGRSTNSIDISDSDYRIKRNLDKTARDIREMPAPNGSAEHRGFANNSVSAMSDVLPRAASEHIRSPELAASNKPLNDAVSANRSPSFTAALQVFQSMQSSQQDADGRKNTALNGRRSLPAHSHNQLRSESSQHLTASPELGKPTPTSQVVLTPLSGVENSSQKSQEPTSGPDPVSNADAILSDDDDEEYPDPLLLLESRSPHPKVKSPLGSDNADVPDNDTDDRQDKDKASVQSVRPWRGLGKRRRKSSNDEEYKSGPLPMVIDKNGTLSADPSVPSRSLDTLHRKSHMEQDPWMERSHSDDMNETPATRMVKAPLQPWTPSKRIRMSTVDSPDNISEHRVQEDSSRSNEENQQSAAFAASSVANLIVLAEASSSYPAIDSTTSQLPSLHGTHAEHHISQTPDGYLNVQPSGVINDLELSSEPSSREPTVPLSDAPINNETTATAIRREDEEEEEEEEEVSDNIASDELYAESASSQDNNETNSSSHENTKPVSTPSTSNGVRRSARIAQKRDQTTPQPSKAILRKAQRQALTTARARRTHTQATRKSPAESGAATQPQPSRQRRPTFSRRITMCQRLLQLSKLSRDHGQMDIRMDPALAQPARLLGHDLRTSAFALDAISAPSTPTRRAAFSGTMRVLGESEPLVTDSDRLRYMCKVKGLIEGTSLSAREALRVLYFFTGDWVSARKYILHGHSALTEDYMWSAKEDEVLLQGFDFEQMQDLRMRKGNVEVYRRLQFLNTFHGLKQQ
ncbi:hypothetical protein IWW36_000063 [Coemansia brasiliensis]|uniref:TRF2-interacting telomeric protein/Rap1 C-terminal domain-containing protein n=1 Tax=Coemansia brasiliensis TaxID=2650707 RepID=A0A9W8IBK0_9FUNG|nr:hypothetical protein IWW36_000063 [Coemansia brasiliensis]